MPTSKDAISSLIKQEDFSKALSELQSLLSAQAAQNSLIQGLFDDIQKNKDDLYKYTVSADNSRQSVIKDLNKLLNYTVDNIELPMILFAASNPINMSKIHFENEFLKINNSISTGKFKYRPVSFPSIDPMTFQTSINEYKPNIIHFSGHGVGNKKDVDNSRAIGRPTARIPEGIVFQKPEDKSAVIIIDANGLKSTFDYFINKKGLKFDLVFLNCCYSSIQAKAIKEAGVSNTIGMKGAIYDETAIVFAELFYNFLSKDNDVKSSFEQACLQLNIQGYKDYDMPEFY
jgi:CHAT domain